MKEHTKISKEQLREAVLDASARVEMWPAWKKVETKETKRSKFIKEKIDYIKESATQHLNDKTIHLIVRCLIDAYGSD